MSEQVTMARINISMLSIKLRNFWRIHAGSVQTTAATASIANLQADQMILQHTALPRRKPPGGGVGGVGDCLRISTRLKMWLYSYSCITGLLMLGLQARVL